MEINELYLKTAFCCMACDGDIASEELALIKEYTSNSGLFSNLDIESKLNEYVIGINQQGILFLNSYLKEVTSAFLTEAQEMNIVRIAIQMIIHIGIERHGKGRILIQILCSHGSI